ncbi:MAG: hypothetical protein JSU98_07125 [Gemmatimonadales bacterium]|nr:MAG: hypothetical protein JSU98_07125 [Gemmatimonadales bacterium]
MSKGLLDEERAEALRAEAVEAHAEATRRWGQILVASLGAVALVLAAGLFASRNWPSLSDGMRTAVLLAGGLVTYGLGLRVFQRLSWRYSGMLLQTGGLGVMLSGLVYSNNAWPGSSPEAIAMGLVALAIPAVVAPISFREGVVMAGVHTALSYAFLAVFLERIFALDPDAIVWALDGAGLLAMGFFLVSIRRWPDDRTDRALAAFAVSMWAGLVLVLLTGTGPLEMDESAMIPADVWLILIVAVTLWGIHRSPSEYRRAVYETNLALCVAVGGFMAMFTAVEVLDLSTEWLAVAGGAVGVSGLWYGLVQRAPQVLLTGALMMLLSTWIFAIDQAGALGGIVALLISAGLLFWVSTRIRAEPPAADR